MLRGTIGVGVRNYASVLLARDRSIPFGLPPCQPSLLHCSISRGPRQHEFSKSIAGISSRTQCASSTVETPTQTQTPDSSTPQNVAAVLRERGLVESITSEEIDKAAMAQSLKVYCGFDPTADSLHLGNLLGIIVLSWFQRCGHAPVALIGGATGRVGDPSGKSAERPVLSDEQIEGNVQGIKEVLRGILERNAPEGAPPVAVLNNLDWFGGMGFLSFLRDVGKFARVGTMLAKESVKTRLASESGISFTEFSYQLLQGYDFFYLCRKEGVRVQVGGSDQWGNITAGTELIRKLWNSEKDGEMPTSFGLTFPLLVDSDGKKFGKSEGGVLWLSADKVSPYKFYQYLFGTADSDIIRFMKILTFLPMQEIDQMEKDMKSSGYVPNTLQKRLAEEVTRYVHGEAGLQQAIKTTEALKPGADTKLDGDALEAIAGDAPSATLPRDQVAGKSVVDIMVAVKMQPSKSAVRRLIKGGGVRVNNVQVKDETLCLNETDIIDGRLVLLATGKKNKLLLQVE
ncbi:hypothetical protein BSKO_05912 [Bryopsis sp. KO-2023]|nr:hypothetical protein BSKO_05912 [Bryopsis sp. KO-2023]